MLTMNIFICSEKPVVHLVGSSGEGDIQVDCRKIAEDVYICSYTPEFEGKTVIPLDST